MTARENPIGLDGFEFVEFTSPDPEALAGPVRQAGLHPCRQPPLQERPPLCAGRHQLHPQHGAATASPPSSARRTARRPTAWPSGSGIGPRRSKLARRARRRPRSRAARGPGELDIPAIEGIGGSYLYLVDRYGAEQIYDVDFEPVPGAGRDDNSVGLHTLDHLTHNVNRGRMDHWADFYEKIFNFRQIRYFDIEGKQTALLSRAMTAPDDKIRIPLNESQDDYQPDRGISEGI